MKKERNTYNKNFAKIERNKDNMPLTEAEASALITLNPSMTTTWRGENKNKWFPKLMRDCRDQSGLSQQKVADYLGIAKATVGQYESGDTIPNAKILSDICELYNVSSDYLIGLTKIPSRDLDMKAVHNMTGLSESALNVLFSIKSDDSISKIISLVLSNKHFLEAVYYIDRAIKEISGFELSLEDLLEHGSNFQGDEWLKPDDRLHIAGKRYINSVDFIKLCRVLAADELKLIVDELSGKNDFDQKYLDDPIKRLNFQDQFLNEKYQMPKQEYFSDKQRKKREPNGVE